MKIVKARAEIMTEINGIEVLKHLEKCGRVCYKSEDRITEESAPEFIKSIIKRGHESVLEHYSLTVKFTCDRGISHEIVRHRIASYSQESTRYCNYGKENEITFIHPGFFSEKWEYGCWSNSMCYAERSYLNLIDNGFSPEAARSVLPHSLKTELIMTANLREWRHFLKLRTSQAAHPQMREIAANLLTDLQEIIPIVFDDIKLSLYE